MLQKIGASLPQVGGPPQVSREKMAWATKQVNLFFGSFRKADADDPETFTAGCLRLFTAYPAEAVRHVIDPVTGLPGKSEWLPTMRAIKDALDAWESDQRDSAHRVALAAAAERQVEERRAWLAKRKDKPTLADLQAKYGERFGLTPVAETRSDRDERQRIRLAEANRELFRKECESAGVDPASGVSPSLRRALDGKAAE